MKKNIILFFLVFCFSRVSLNALHEEPFVSPESYSKHLDNISLDATANNNSFSYTSIGVALPFPIPGVQVGHRKKFHSSAIDFSGAISTLVIVSGLSVNSRYIKYLSKNNYYLGGGAGLGVAFVRYIPVNYGITPSVSFGKENEKSFHQLDATIASFSDKGLKISPTLSYQYGFKF